MKFFKELSAIELKECVNELKEWTGSYIDKIYFDSELAIRFHHADKGKIILRYVYPYLFLTKKIPEIKNKGFGLLLKKYIEHQKITNIYQLGSERVVVFELSNNQKLIFELFFHGNILILNDNNEIIAMSNPKGGKKKDSKKYNLTPEINVFEMSFDEFKEKVKDKEIVKALARLVGGIYAEEVLWRARIEKNKILNETEIDSVFKKMQELIKESPKYIIGKDFFAVRKLKSQEWNRTFKSFSEMIETIVEKNPYYDEKIEKLKRAIEMQKEEIKEHEEKIKELETIIEEIYNHYNELETIIKGLQKNENVNIEKINEHLIGIKIMNIDKKNKTIELKFVNS